MKLLNCQNCNGELDLQSAGVGNVIVCAYCGSQHILSQELNKYQDSTFLIFLRGCLIEYFSMTDIKFLCDDLYARTRMFDFDDIAGQTRSGKALALVQFARRRGMLSLLVEVAMYQNRPFALAVDGYVRQEQ